MYFKTNNIMTRSSILNALTFEDASVIQLTVYSYDLSLRLSGSFPPISAMRLIRMLPAKFTYSYLPIE